MPFLKGAFDKLKQKVLGVSTTNIDTKLDAAVNDILAYKSNAKINGYLDIVQTLIAKSATQNDVSTMFQGPPTPAIYGQAERINRYKLFESIVDNISYCCRALNVIVDNILAPDDITKQSMEVRQKDLNRNENSVEAGHVSLVKEIIKNSKLEKNTDIIVKNTLLYGDFFIEIADTNNALVNRSFLLESALLTDTSGNANNKEEIHCETENKKFRIILDFSSLEESKKTKIDKLKKKNKEIKNNNVKHINDIQLLFHEPFRVVKLQTDLFPVCFGYLVFPKIENIMPYSTPDANMINNICRDILNKVRNKIGDYGLDDDEELKSIVAKMIGTATDFTKAFNVRFISADRMQHFKVPSIKNYPYGESIMTPIKFLAKVLMALETALAISRLSRSTEKRKIAIEVGLTRDIKKAVENLKEQFRKRKISLDSFGGIDTIPSQITTFEDIYIPQKDGKAFVDVSTFSEGNIDIRGKVDEIKEIRDQIVAGMNVPPSFVGLEENLSNKSALSEENILFARCVITHQKYLSEQMTEAVQKIIDILNPEEALEIMDSVEIAFPAPKSLQFEREARYLSDLANLIESLDRIGIPKEYAKKRYMTGIDWQEVEQYQMETSIDKTLEIDHKPEEDGGFGGGFGGMGTDLTSI
jgi:hypothetical protein